MNLQIMPHTKPGSSNPQMALPTGLGFEIEKVVGGGGALTFFFLRLIAITVETEGNWSLLLHFSEARVIARNCRETAACNIMQEE